MQTKHIEKLEELIGEKWNFNKKKFELEKSYAIGYVAVLHMLNCKENSKGEEENKSIFWVNEKNYKELEFYGLEVVLNGEPKITESDNKWLSQEIYIARDEDGDLFGFFGKPERGNYAWNNKNSYYFRLDSNMFPFITWESGKAWSKAELMELEVV